MREQDLLRKYAENGDQLAFRQLVDRRTGLVYASTLRSGGKTRRYAHLLSRFLISKELSDPRASLS